MTSKGTTILARDAKEGDVVEIEGEIFEFYQFFPKNVMFSSYHKTQAPGEQPRSHYLGTFYDTKVLLLEEVPPRIVTQVKAVEDDEDEEEEETEAEYWTRKMGEMF